MPVDIAEGLSGGGESVISYITLCSGIECASLAARPLGWQPLCFAEIEPFPSAVLAHHYPDVPNVGDMTRYDWSRYKGLCDVLIAGTPCQAFSIAGRRESLADDRGNLTLKFAEICDDIDPKVVVWENVVGVLSLPDNAFGCLLGRLAGEDSPIVPPGGKWTYAGMVAGPVRTIVWRVLDAQHFGVPQRRRRVYLVGCPRSSGIDPSKILFERKSVSGDFVQSQRERKISSGNASDCAGVRGGIPGISPTVSSKWAKGSGGPAGDECQNLIPCLTGNPYGDNASREGLLIAYCIQQGQIGRKNKNGPQGKGWDEGVCATITNNHHPHVVAYKMSVRRLTPRECERLQGLPDDYTLIPYRGKPAADAPRYKAIGNGMAVSVVSWLFRRIHAIYQGI